MRKSDGELKRRQGFASSGVDRECVGIGSCKDALPDVAKANCVSSDCKMSQKLAARASMRSSLELVAGIMPGSG